uniref:Uncharacterized protein n=1 Tax=Anguilla anguilla TaxID=7936 RepID=A0A0E9TXN4_ANGAN
MHWARGRNTPWTGHQSIAGLNAAIISLYSCCKFYNLLVLYSFPAS